MNRVVIKRSKPTVTIGTGSKAGTPKNNGSPFSEINLAIMPCRNSSDCCCTPTYGCRDSTGGIPMIIVRLHLLRPGCREPVPCRGVQGARSPLMGVRGKALTQRVRGKALT